jgi:hypothetical protein
MAVLTEWDASGVKARWGLTELLRLCPTCRFCPVAIRYDNARYHRPAIFLDVGEPFRPTAVNSPYWADRVPVMNEVAASINDQVHILTSDIVTCPEQFYPKLRRRTALIAGQHLELADVERQLEGLPGIDGGRAFAVSSSDGSERLGLVLRMHKNRPLEQNIVLSYLIEKYALEAPILRESLRKQLSITFV